MRIYILFGLFWGMIGCISDDIPSVSYTHLGVGTVKILGLNSQSDYIFRAKLGNHVSQEYNFKTEVVSQVPNSDMENWSKEKIKSYRYYPWASGESDPWWNTNNLRTTSYQGTWSYGYKMCIRDRL